MEKLQVFKILSKKKFPLVQLSKAPSFYNQSKIGHSATVKFFPVIPTSNKVVFSSKV